MNKSWQKLVKSLHLKKFREQEQLFIVEGGKSVLELLQSQRFDVVAVFYTEKFEKEFIPKLSKNLKTSTEFILSKVEDIQSAGTFQSNEYALAVVKFKQDIIQSFKNEFVIALDEIRDPGNLGTIIRIADWYGIHKIYCSEHSTDFYNPKVINATMGSFCRVEVMYVSLVEWLGQQRNMPIFGALMDGQNIHKADFGKQGIVVMGNESNGISKQVIDLLTHKITIPRFGKAESLNVAIATAIFCDNIFRGK